MRVQVTWPDCGLGNSFDNSGSGEWRWCPHPLPWGCVRPAWDPLDTVQLDNSRGSASELGGSELWQGSVIPLLSGVSCEHENDTE